MTKALVLFAHGARDPRWADPFHAIARRMQALDPRCRVELAFLELMAPDLGTLVQRLVDDGVARIDVLPMFLGMGGHLRNDVPPLLEHLRATHAGLDIRLHPPIGENAAVVDAMAAAALAVATFGE